VTAYANVENVLDKRYEEVAGYPALKANFRAGMRLRFGGGIKQLTAEIAECAERP
jgi:outer membrane receptor protein involved in Fe transport